MAKNTPCREGPLVQGKKKRCNGEFVFIKKTRIFRFYQCDKCQRTWRIDFDVAGQEDPKEMVIPSYPRRSTPIRQSDDDPTDSPWNDVDLGEGEG